MKERNTVLRYKKERYVINTEEDRENLLKSNPDLYHRVMERDVEPELEEEVIEEIEEELMEPEELED